MATDQEIRDAGILYMPKQKYLQNPYKLPIAPVPPTEPVPGGITNTNAFTNSGGFNSDDNRITNQNYNPSYLQDARFNNEMSFVGATDPRYSSEINNMGIKRAQSQYNLARNNRTASGPMTPERQAEVLRTRNDLIQDNRQNYGAQGQYETVPSDMGYKTRTEAMKNMEMNNNISRNNDGSPSLTGQNVTGNYYGLDEPEQSTFEKFARNSPILGTGIRGIEFAGDFLSKMIPTSRRSYIENELGNQNVFVDDIGRIVQGKGDYNTAQNVMANYNASNITQETLDKRIKTINDTIKRKLAKDPNYKKTQSFTDLEKRKGAINEYGDINNLANKNADFILDNPEEEEKKKKKSNVISRFLTKKKDAKVAKEAQEAQDAQDAQDAKDATAAVTTPMSGTTTSSGLSAQEQQTLNDAYNAQSQSSRDRQDQAGGGGGGQFDGADTKSDYDSDPTSYSGSFAKGGRAGYFFGGRVGFKNGGLASIL